MHTYMCIYVYSIKINRYYSSNNLLERFRVKEHENFTFAYLCMLFLLYSKIWKRFYVFSPTYNSYTHVKRSFGSHSFFRWINCAISFSVLHRHMLPSIAFHSRGINEATQPIQTFFTFLWRCVQRRRKYWRQVRSSVKIIFSSTTRRKMSLESAEEGRKMLRVIVKRI